MAVPKFSFDLDPELSAELRAALLRNREAERLERVRQEAEARAAEARARAEYLASLTPEQRLAYEELEQLRDSTSSTLNQPYNKEFSLYNNSELKRNRIWLELDTLTGTDTQPNSASFSIGRIAVGAALEDMQTSDNAKLLKLAGAADLPLQHSDNLQPGLAL